MKNTKTILKYAIGLLITAGALYLAFRGQDFSVIGKELAQTNILALSGLVLFQILAHFIRGWRWQFLLRPIKEKTSLWIAFKAVMAGYAMNNVIPRSGELIRPAMASVEEEIPFAGTLATIVVERIFDVIALGLIFVYSLFSFENEFKAAFPDLSGAALPLLVMISLGLIIFVAIFISKRVSKFFHQLIQKTLPQKISTPVSEAFETFTKGLHGLQRDTAVPIIFGTVAIWIFYFVSTWCGLFCIPGSGIEAIGIKGTVVLLALSGIAVTIPTPGGTGTYHYFTKSALILFFAIPSDTAAAFAIVTHAAPYVVVTLLGLFYMLRAGVSLKSAKKSS